MKVEKIIKETIDITITEARLLTKEESDALPERLRLYNGWWWTSSASAMCSYIVFGVDGYYGDINFNLVSDANVVRPVVIFESASLKIGNRISVAGLEFEVIANNLAFCLGDIGDCAFREDQQAKYANDYEKSDIKKYVDKWFMENVK